MKEYAIFQLFQGECSQLRVSEYFATREEAIEEAKSRGLLSMEHPDLFVYGPMGSRVFYCIIGK